MAGLLCLALLPWAALAQLQDSTAAPQHAARQITADPAPDAAADKALALRDEDHLADRQAMTLRVACNAHELLDTMRDCQT